MTPAPRLAVEYAGITELRGPLLVVRARPGIGWDEFAVIRTTSDATGSDVRHGLVLEVDRDLAVVQVLEGTDGLTPHSTRVSFAGRPLHVPVGPGWLGRVCNGRGEPVDGGPPISGTRTEPVSGPPEQT